MPRALVSYQVVGDTARYPQPELILPYLFWLKENTEREHFVIRMVAEQRSLSPRPSVAPRRARFALRCFHRSNGF
jgi:hypothetical protein